MRVIATQGDRKLIDLGSGRGAIIDEDGEIGPTHNLHSILARGYWDHVDEATITKGDMEGHEFHGNQWTG